MKHHTQAPYYLTLKSNGCLILISALSPSHLMVASKHSLGTTTEAQESEKANTVDALADGLSDLSVDPKAKGKAGKGKGKEGASRDEKEEEGEQEARQHAEVGRDWLRRTLKGMGKTEAQLARRLWDDNLTAVLEVRLVRTVSITVASVLTSYSCATIHLRSTSLPHLSIGRAFTCTVSTLTPLISRPCTRPMSLRLPTNSASSQPRVSSCRPWTKSNPSPTKSPKRARGKAIRSKGLLFARLSSLRVKVRSTEVDRHIEREPRSSSKSSLRNRTFSIDNGERSPASCYPFWRPRLLLRKPMCGRRSEVG